MKTFKELMEAPGAPAADNKPEMDSDDEVKGYVPRSQGEEEFAKLHVVTDMGHPVATQAQFKGTMSAGDPDKHIGGKNHAGGENMVKLGASKIRESFSNFVKVEDHGDD